MGDFPKQTFAYTEPNMPAAGLVKFLQAFEADGGVEIRMRNTDGVTSSIVLPDKLVDEFVKSIRESVKPLQEI